MCQKNQDKNCKYWTYNFGTHSCYLLTRCDNKQIQGNKQSGTPNCIAEPLAGKMKKNIVLVFLSFPHSIINYVTPTPFSDKRKNSIVRINKTALENNIYVAGGY